MLMSSWSEQSATLVGFFSSNHEALCVRRSTKKVLLLTSLAEQIVHDIFSLFIILMMNKAVL